MVVGNRRLLALREPLTGVVASPDGRWLLIAAPDSGQWLLVRTSGPGHPTALSRVGRQFDPGGRGPAALPRGGPDPLSAQGSGQLHRYPLASWTSAC